MQPRANVEVDRWVRPAEAPTLGRGAPRLDPSACERAASTRCSFGDEWVPARLEAQARSSPKAGLAARRSESHECLRKLQSRTPRARLNGCMGFGASGSPPRRDRGRPGASAMSPIWRSGCQGVGVDGHGLVGGAWLMWLRLAGRSGRPRVRDGGHAHIRGLAQDLCSSHVRCLLSSAAAGVGGCSGD